jgi:hypothetical protein
MRFFLMSICIMFTLASEAGRIRLRKVPEAPKVCKVMKEDPLLSRRDKKILATLKNSLIINEQVSLVNDLGQKQCIWPVEKFQPLGDVRNANFYIDEYKNVLVAYQKVPQGMAQVQINIDQCQFDEYKLTDEVNLPKCSPPKKIRKSKKKIET